MDASNEVSVQSPATNERSHPIARPSPPRPPKPYESTDKENHNTISNGSTRLTKKLSNGKDKPAAPTKVPAEGGNVQLARAGETILETFYGLMYVYEAEIKDWKLAADGYIPLCFIQERGNANKPFKVIAARGSVRLMEFPVTKDTKCTQNKAFIRWHDSPAIMYGVRFNRENQANQFFSAMERMRSTLVKTAELFKQPERKAMVSHISDPTVEGVSHTKISLIIKLPNKETTIMSVPGLISIGELFELICKKENLVSRDHQLNLPKIGSKELDYEPNTVLGSLKIREVSIVYIGRASSNSTVEGDISPKESQASVTAIGSAPSRPNSSYIANRVTPSSERKASPLSQSNEQLDKQKKEAVKVKRKAPPPPPQQRRERPERPKSMPIPRPRTNESVAQGAPQSTPQAKKRQAPARPPAPKIPRDAHKKTKSPSTDERTPPEFFPPPPPDDIPPPLDECEHPVSPLSDEDLHESWMTSSGHHESSSGYLTSFKDEPQDVTSPSDPSPSLGQSQELASPESIPLKFLLPSPESSAENDDVTEREQSSRISFVGDSRSSSVDISDELPTSPSLDYTPPIDLREIETDVHITEEEPPSVFSPPPPSDFSQMTNISLNYNSRNMDFSTGQDDEFIITAPPPPDFNENENDKFGNTDIESMVVPPPPVMFEDSPEEQDVISKESNVGLESEVGFSIPPPSGFEEEGAGSPVELSNDKESSKTKLGLSTEMFPWLSEPQTKFKAEISTTQEHEPSVSDRGNSNEEQSLNTVQSQPIPQTELPLLRNQDMQENNILNQPINVRYAADTAPQNVPTEMPLLRQHQNRSAVVESASMNNDIEIPASYIEHSKEAKIMKDNNENDLQTSKDKVSNIGTPEIPTPKVEHSLKVSEEEQKGTSSDEGSSSFKTPFDDLGSMENSLSSSVTSEFEDDFPDFKHLKRLSTEKIETFHQSSYDTEKQEVQENKESPASEDTNQSMQYNEAEASHLGKSSKVLSASVGAGSIIRSNDQVTSKEPISNEPVIESSSATPIAIPVDILFHSLELSKTTPETALSQSNDQSVNIAKRPVNSGFKTQSWADIKNQERIMEEERQRKINLDKMQQSQSSITSEKKHAPASADVRSVPIKEKTSTTEPPKSSSTQPSVLEEKQDTSIRTSVTTTTTGVSPSSRTYSKPKQEPQRHEPRSYVSSAMDRHSSSHVSKNNTSASQTSSSSFSGKTFSVPPSKRSDTNMLSGSQNASMSNSDSEEKSPVSKSTVTTNQNSIEQFSSVTKTEQSYTSSQGVQGVIMRKKASTQDAAQKRKSVQDMMKMFRSEDDDDERGDGTDVIPRQSPALRLLEEKMGYRERSSSDGSVDTSEITTTHSISSKSASERNVPEANPVTESKSDRPKLDSTSVNVSRQTTKSSTKDTDSSRIRPRTNSALTTPKPYGVLFPREQKSHVKVNKTSDTNVEAKKETHLLSKKSTPKPYDVLFPKEKNEETYVESQRHSVVGMNKEVEKKPDHGETKPQPMLNIVKLNDDHSEAASSSVDRTKHVEHSKPKQKELTNSNPSKRMEESKSDVTVEKSKSITSGDIKEVKTTSQPVELRKKQSATDPIKRHSMPVNLMESKSTSSYGANLKILMAPQITDVDVVPKGRVAAMKANWKSEDQ